MLFHSVCHCCLITCFQLAVFMEAYTKASAHGTSPQGPHLYTPRQAESSIHVVMVQLPFSWVYRACQCTSQLVLLLNVLGLVGYFSTCDLLGTIYKLNISLFLSWIGYYSTTLCYRLSLNIILMEINHLKLLFFAFKAEECLEVQLRFCHICCLVHVICSCKSSHGAQWVLYRS